MAPTRRFTRSTREGAQQPDEITSTASGPATRGSTSNFSSSRQTRRPAADLVAGSSRARTVRTVAEAVAANEEDDGGDGRPRRNKRRRAVTTPNEEDDEEDQNSVFPALTARASGSRTTRSSKTRKATVPTQTTSASAGTTSTPRTRADASTSAGARFPFNLFSARAADGSLADSPSESPPPADLDSKKRTRGRSRRNAAGPSKTPEPFDRLTRLPRELLHHIFSYVAAPVPAAGNAPPAAGRATNRHATTEPDRQIDRNSLALSARTCRVLLAHARLLLYRNLVVETRVQAHALHRTLHANEMNKDVRHVTADVEAMAKTSSHWTGWFIFHSMHSLCGIIGSCRGLLSLTLFMPSDSAAWAQSLCQSLVDLKNLHTLVKDLYPSQDRPKHKRGIGHSEGMDVGWATRTNTAMWAVSQLIRPLGSLTGLQTLRISGLSSDSSTTPPPPTHTLRLKEVVLIDVNITNLDLAQVLGDAKSLQKFTLWGSSLLSKRGLVSILKKCPALVELRVGGSWFGAKEEDDKHFPLNEALPLLPRLKILHVSGALISPAALEIPSVALSHLFVHACPAWTPSAVHSALSKMSHDPPAVERLTLPVMADARARGGSRRAGADEPGSSDGWTETWRFTVRKTGEAKGCSVKASMEEHDAEAGRAQVVDSDSE